MVKINCDGRKDIHKEKSFHRSIVSFVHLLRVLGGFKCTFNHANLLTSYTPN